MRVLSTKPVATPATNDTVAIFAHVESDTIAPVRRMCRRGGPPVRELASEQHECFHILMKVLALRVTTKTHTRARLRGGSRPLRESPLHSPSE